MCFTSLLEVCDLHIAPDYPIILKFTKDSTGGNVYDKVAIKLKYSWKDVPRIEKFVPHLNPEFYIEYKTTELPSFPIDKSQWQKASSDKLKVGVPVKSEEGWKVLPVEFRDQKLMDMGFEPNLCYSLRLVNQNPNWVKEGNPCAIKYENENYERGVVIGVGEEILVHCVDKGFSSFKQSSEVFDLPKQFGESPPFTIQACVEVDKRDLTVSSVSSWRDAVKDSGYTVLARFLSHEGELTKVKLFTNPNNIPNGTDREIRAIF